MRHAFAIAVVGALALAACNDAASSDVNAPRLQRCVAVDADVGADALGPVPAEPHDVDRNRHGGDGMLGPDGLRAGLLPCPGTSQGAAVAECNSGNCLDGATVCCLYGLQCG